MNAAQHLRAALEALDAYSFHMRGAYYAAGVPLSAELDEMFKMKIARNGLEAMIKLLETTEGPGPV